MPILPSELQWEGIRQYDVTWCAKECEILPTVLLLSSFNDKMSVQYPLITPIQPSILTHDARDIDTYRHMLDYSPFRSS